MAWYSIKDEAIVLRVFPWRESDRRYRLLTRNHGKVDALGRGAQKEKAKLAPALEPFAIIDVELVRGARNTTVISVEKRERFWHVMRELDQRLLAKASLHLIDRFTQEFDQDSDLFDITVDWLRFINTHTLDSHTRSTFLLGGFLMRILEHFGYQTQLKDCIHCRASVMPLSYRWHGGKGGLVCMDCVRADEREWFSARHIEEEVVKLLRFARQSDFQDLLKPSLSGMHVSDFANVIHDLVSFHMPGAHDLPFWRAVLHDVPLEEPVNYR